MLLCAIVPVISYQYISHSTLQSNGEEYEDTTMIGEELTNDKAILVLARAEHVLNYNR
jgi:hypothetical protein